MNNNLQAQEVLLSGAAAAPGIAVGKASLYRQRRPRIYGQNIADDQVDHQLERFEKALDIAREELDSLRAEQDHEDASDLLQTQIQMLHDPDLRSRIKTEIKDNNKAADAAIDKVFGDYLNVMKKQEGLLKERSVDISDVRDRLIQIVNNEDGKPRFDPGTILVAHNLSPREVIEFSENNIAGIIMDKGGTTSHAAILARAMQIPAIVGVKDASDTIGAEELLILDGVEGSIVVNPSTGTRKKYDERISRVAEEHSREQALCQQKSKTADGHSFVLRANVEFQEELNFVDAYQAEGIGLLRTESMYLHQSSFRDEEKQCDFYRTVLKATEPHPVTVRLFDAGGDKFFDLGQEEQNPFLGWRGIRMLLDQRPLLEQQLKAILKSAGSYPGRTRILVPMVTTLDEVEIINKTVQNLQEKLKEENYEVDEEVEVGLMVEVPNVAVQAEDFARKTDFLSIGTNDLTQYLLAVDRGNERISNLYDQRQPAVWRLIQMVADAGQKTGTPVSVCGELASDPVAACCLLGMGINELSMTPALLPKVKQALCAHTLEEMNQLASHVLKCTTTAEVDTLFSNF